MVLATPAKGALVVCQPTARTYVDKPCHNHVTPSNDMIKVKQKVEDHNRHPCTTGECGLVAVHSQKGRFGRKLCDNLADKNQEALKIHRVRNTITKVEYDLKP